MAKFYIKVNEIELGTELDMEELGLFGEAMAEIITPDFIDRFKDMLKDALKTTNPVEDEPEEEEEPEPEKDQEDDEELKVNVTTFDSDKTKYKFVKSWLKTGGIEFEESPSIGGKKISYKLSSDDIVALEQYLVDNEVDKNILI